MEDLKTVEMLIKELCASKGYELYSFKYIAREKNLEVVIDRDEPINLDDITVISQEISDLLDVHDFTPDAYTLNVSSLGAEKPIDIQKLEKYVGKYVNLHLSHPYKGLNILEGTILECDENNLTLTYKDKTRDIKVNLNRNDIDKARLAIKF
jgi:ribosome maturation factor RimP